MEARLNEVQSNFNARQGEVTGMLDKILAAVAAVSSAADVRDIGTREGLAGAGGLS